MLNQLSASFQQICVQYKQRTGIVTTCSINTIHYYTTVRCPFNRPIFTEITRVEDYFIHLLLSGRVVVHWVCWRHRRVMSEDSSYWKTTGRPTGRLDSTARWAEIIRSTSTNCRAHTTTHSGHLSTPSLPRPGHGGFLTLTQLRWENFN